MTMRTESSARWVRGYAGDVSLVDSRRALLFWDEGVPVPSYAFPEADVRLDLLTPAAAPETWDRFFGPHGPVSDVWDLNAGDDTRRAVAWRRDDPALDGHAVLSWQPGVLRWTEKEETVFGHPRDPHHRVDALPSSRHVVVSAGRRCHQGSDRVLQRVRRHHGRRRLGASPRLTLQRRAGLEVRAKTHVTTIH